MRNSVSVEVRTVCAMVRTDQYVRLAGTRGYMAPELLLVYLPNHWAAIGATANGPRSLHEIEAYEDFCRYRQDVRDASGARTSVSRQEWLEARRDALHSRMRRRRGKSGAERGKGRGPRLLG